jgi:diacylglycerol kinase (ATP)
MRTCVILNPVAGRGTTLEWIRRTVSSIPGAEIRISPAPGSVGPLAVEAVADGFGRIVAAGGDGTVSALASALLDSEADVECGLLPIGTGNDLARSLGVPTHPGRAVAILYGGEATPIDAIHASASGTSGPERPERGSQVSEVRELHVWNAVVGGFGGRISDRLNPGMRRRWRGLAYLRAAVAEFGEMRSHRVRLEIDGRRTEQELLMLVIANGRYAGGGIPFAPGARVDDGWLDVVAIRAVPFARLAVLVPRVLAGRHLADPNVEHTRARTVSVEAEPGFWFNVDGETWFSGSATFELRPRALPFIRP